MMFIYIHITDNLAFVIHTRAVHITRRSIFFIDSSSFVAAYFACLAWRITT